MLPPLPPPPYPPAMKGSTKEKVLKERKKTTPKE